MNINKGFAPIITIIIAVIIITGGIGGYLYIKNKSQITAQRNTPTSTEQVSIGKNVSTSTQSSTSLDISTWKNLNTDYISLKYPNDWTIRPTKPKEFVAVLSPDKKSGLIITVTKITGLDITQESVCASYRMLDALSKSVSIEREIKIDNLSGKAYDTEDKDKNSTTEVCLGTQNYVYGFVFNPSISNIYLSKMLATVKIKLK